MLSSQLLLSQQHIHDAKSDVRVTKPRGGGQQHVTLRSDVRAEPNKRRSRKHEDTKKTIMTFNRELAEHAEIAFAPLRGAVGANSIYAPSCPSCLRLRQANPGDSS